ncbi:MAG: protein-L-isoaspartate(D-aspartate) O-methyltransferase [candidate division WOR-3 bacterium]
MANLRNEYAINCERMIKEQIIARGVKNERVLNAIRQVPRHLFVDPALVHQAYDDYPLPISADQTISQPYIVALMTEYLDVQENHKVLEIGTGSGYQTAILAKLAKTVYTVERIAELSIKARKTLNRLGFRNIIYKIGDGSLGWPEFAPYDRIIVTAAAEFMPNALISQLAESGKIVVPIGKGSVQTLTLGIKHQSRLIHRKILDCTFVPLITKSD